MVDILDSAESLVEDSLLNDDEVQTTPSPTADSLLSEPAGEEMELQTTPSPTEKIAADAPQRRTRGGVGNRDTAKTKERLLRYVADGITVEEALKRVGKSMKTWEYYRSSDKDFAAKVDAIRAARHTGSRLTDTANVALSFAEFRDQFLGMKTFPHQQNIIDLIEGRQPSWLHQSMIYEPGRPNYVLVNVPPEHAKSMTTSIDYPVYRICMDPNVRILIVSKSQTKAAEFLYAIKQRLTHPFYSKLQVAYAAGSGFKSKTATWQANTVYLGEELRDSAEKDPTIQALGIGGQVYGARADLIILDDCVTLSNAHEYEKQIRWIQQEVLTRIGPGGKLLVLGTRVDSIDLYRELRNAERYPTGESPWSYLSMPAVLDFAEDPAKWVTLWPKSDRPWQGDEDAEADAEGMFPRWDGRHLNNRRAALDPRTWSMVYQQADVDEDAVFNPVCVKGSVNRVRRIGPLSAGLPGHPERTDSLMIFAGLDPAIVGDTAAVVMAVDRATKKRYVLDAQAITRPSPQQIRDLITTITEKYRPTEWMVERNAFQGYLTQDEGLRQWMASRGVLLREHTTSKNKWDVGFGVAAMSTLFGTVEANGRHHRDNLLELPADRHEGVRMLIDQLITWSPETKNKTDLVMALWFCEIRAKEICQSGAYGGHYLKNPFLTRSDMNKRLVVNLDDWAAEHGPRSSMV